MTIGLLALVLALQAAPTTPRKASITGVVINKVTGDPVGNVAVTLARMDAPSAAAKYAREIMAQNRDQAPGAAPFEAIIPSQLAAARLDNLPPARAGGTELENLASSRSRPEDALVAMLGIEKVHSVFVDSAGRMAIVSSSSPPIQTDATGRFAFRNLEPGDYRLVFAANGFVREDYDQRGAGGGSPLLIKAGQAIEGLTMRVTPTAVISGRITDTGGQPLAGATVRLFRSGYDGNGKQNIRPQLTAHTNDRGEYRFYYVTPGRYYVAAADPGFLNPSDTVAIWKTLRESVGPVPSPNRLPERRYAVSYFPGTPDAGSATALDVTAGANRNDVDIALTSQGSYSVRGRVADPNGGVPRQAMIRLIRSSEDDGVRAPPGLRYDPADGSFEFPNVTPGSYVVMAELSGWSSPPTLPIPNPATVRMNSMSEAERQSYLEAMNAFETASAAARPYGFLSVTVTDTNVERLLVNTAVAGSLAGRVRVEGRKQEFGKDREFQEVWIGLQTMDSDGGPTTGFSARQPQAAAVHADGTFRSVVISPGGYWLRVHDLPSGYYVKSARLGDLDALNRPVLLPAANADAVLDIVLSNKAGQVDGVANDSSGRPMPGALAVLIPDRYRERAELFHAVRTDGAGRFSIPDIEPGDYHIAVWLLLEPYGFFDPALIRQAQEKGKAVRVNESSKQNVKVEVFASATSP